MPRLAPVIKTVFCAMFIQPPCSPLSPESAPIPASILMTFDGGALSTGRRCELSAALEQEATDGVILRQADRPLVGVGRLRLPSQATKEMAAHGPVGLVGGDRDPVDGVEQRQAGLGPLRLGDGGRPADPGAEGRRQSDEMV